MFNAERLCGDTRQRLYNNNFHATRRYSEFTANFISAIPAR